MSEQTPEQTDEDHPDPSEQPEPRDPNVDESDDDDPDNLAELTGDDAEEESEGA